jgi:ferric-dicitrate binding protein FerR (iron transport regulator)
MPGKRLSYLFQQSLAGALPVDDMQELHALMEDPAHALLVEQLLADALKGEGTGIGKYVSEEKGAAILNSIFLAAGSARPAANKPVRRVAFVRYWWAAAAVVLLAVAGVLLWKQPAVGPRLVAQPAIAPGGDKAILTLSNGQQIILDQAGNGMLAEQNGIRIIKLSSGQLSYQASGSEKSKIEKSYNTLTTPRGGQFQVVLPDGTQVWLNSASTLTYPVVFTGKKREVVLKGEAYFEVKQQASQPFLVNAGDVNIHVLGTGFNVMAYEEEGRVATTLVEGSVAVSDRDNTNRVLLLPRQQAGLLRNERRFTVRQPDMEQVLAWKNGYFSFEKTDLRAIMRQIERWYNVKVEYRGVIGEIVLTGRVSRKEYASQLLELLEMEGSVHFEVTGNHIVVIAGPGK